ncbi:Elongator complex protein 2 [Auxenochlorella protothecoides]|uniref:Elongator complex protein 2 n=1 Tax=Auxenochlorella protothecoides TaxID=3075 RepID=A0A087SLL3_AUXPR|nr:Elongator complex protein 2 [Auxenochlorella protothecoides]KFM26617.1 Elongator complex protein 2 [Auxenochlorella protothecoides]
MEVHIEQEHHAAGCNRASQALAWGRSGLIAYAAQHTILVYDPQAQRVVTSLLGHTGEVRCLLWLPTPGQSLLASGSCDGTIRLWSLHENSPLELAVLPAATTPVSSLAALLLPAEDRLLLCASSGGAGVAHWSLTLQNGALVEVQAPAQPSTLHAGQPIVHSVALTHGPASAGDSALLAVGGVDCSVSLYVRGPGGDFLPGPRLKGHADWVRGLAWTHAPGRLLLASASQDRYIRPEAEALLTRFAPRPRLALGGIESLEVMLEALLVGHEDWVQSVAWQPAGDEGRAPCLLSASMDRTLMLWQPDPSGLWMSAAALGDAGANHLGYYTGVWSPCGSAAAAHGYTGSLHVWRRDGQAPGAEGPWHPVPAPTGHVAAVVDAAWAGDCLLTVSEDQTARCWARCVGVENGDGAARGGTREAMAGGHRWREVARPQVHGHDFSGLAVVPEAAAEASTSGEVAGESSRAPPCYASCSEEKVVRVFTAPRTFTATLAALTGRGSGAGAEAEASLDAGPEQALGAALPALGLSNKALAQSTLWPEVRKLYGHGNEVACLAGDPAGRYLASAGLAAGDAATAAIWLWDARARWAPAGELEAHTLTVMRLAFSPRGDLLASVSRDRTLALWRRRPLHGDGGEGCAPPFTLVARVKAASRLLFDVSWAPDEATLATGSRDGIVALWRAAPGSSEALTKSLELRRGSAVRALAFCPGELAQGSFLLALGHEDGTLCVLRFRVQSGNALEVVWQRATHAGPVRRLAWRRDDGEEGSFLLASCSSDGSVRIWHVAG